jgi:flavodoxin
MNRNFLTRLIAFLILACFAGGCSYTPMTLNKDVSILKSAEPDYPKSIVVYDSWSGNTKLVADAIAGELRCPAVHVDQIVEYNISDYDLIVIGSPVHGGMPTGKIDEFLSNMPKPRMSAVFVTFGAPLFGPATANACLDKMEKKLQGTCLGRFKCRGYHKLIFTYPSHPDQQDKADAKQFAAEIREICLHPENAESQQTQR